MKQYPTQEQWDKLNWKEKENFINIYFGGLNMNFNPSDKNKEIEPKLSNHFTIGQMLEYLGPDFKKFLSDDRMYEFKDGEIYVFVKGGGKMIFCDALWIACVNKLKTL